MSGLQRVSTALLLLVLLALPLSARAGQNPGIDGQEMAIVRLEHRRAHELLDTVQAALSTEGRCSVDAVSNSLIVIEQPERLERIRRLLQELDRPVAQLLVTLLVVEQSTVSGHLSTRNPPYDRGRGRLSTKQGQRSRQVQLRLSSGSSGYLRVGRDIPFDRFWLMRCRNHGFRQVWLREYQRVETGLQVTATKVGGQVDLHLVPHLSFDRDHMLRFVEAEIQLRVGLNRWVPVLRSQNGDQELFAALAGAGRGEQQVEMAVRVSGGL